MCLLERTRSIFVRHPLFNMDMAGDVLGLAAELEHAVNVIMDPSTAQQSRMEAYVACEKFKEISPLCAQAGLYLASGPFNPAVRHFGLQLMEHTVKFKWNTISQQEKLFIKENAMKLLSVGVGPAEDISISHIKDALSRIIVEMVKREWPQQWTTLLAELSDACSKGEAQTELVLLIFLRLVEDVALLQTIESNQRRKDIYQALTVNMTEIFNFFLRLIELHVGVFRTSPPHKSRAHSRVVQVGLLTLTGFVEWVSIVHIMAGDGRLLQILCILLNDVEFQTPAAECLSQIVNRKGQIKDRKPLIVLFSENAIQYIVRAANSTHGATPEQNYNFLKKLMQVLTGMASQIIALTGKEEIIRVNELTQFLETIFSLTRHPSLTLSHGACLIWLTLLKHEHISKEPVMFEYIRKLIEIIGPKVIKIPYPIERSVEINGRPEIFISIDFDSEEEYTIFFHRCRTTILEIFRQATLIAPLITFAYCEQWLTVRLQKSATETNTTCRVQDPVYIEWEALVNVLDGVLSRILMVTERPSVATGLRLLEQSLKVETHDPLILSILLSCISSLFVFLSMSSCQITAGNCVAMSGVSLLPRVLEKIFAGLVTTTEIKSQSVAVKNLRRHAASLMVKLGIKYPLLLLPVFDQINTTVQNLMRQPKQLNRNEKIMLQEALLVISNHFCDYERQTNFVLEVLHDSQAEWSSLAQMIKNGSDFVVFAGLDKVPVLKDLYMENRQNLLEAVNLVLGVVRRCSWPDDPDRASRGGFVVGLTESGNPICRNPATPHVIPLLPHILSLLRVLNDLFSTDALARLSDGFKTVYGMIENEKRSLMGISPVLFDPMDPEQRKYDCPVEKMQINLTILFDNCYHLMGSAGPSLGRDLYQLPGIANALIGTIFSGLENIPDYRLRPIIRVFLKPFVYSCPPAFYEVVLLPIFAQLAPLMLNRLTNKWQYIMALYESGELGEDVNDTQEVFEDMLNRTLTREYLDVMKVALVGGSILDNNSGNGGGGVGSGTSDSAMDHDDHSMDGSPHGTTRASQSAMTAEVISELGNKLLRNHLTCTPLVLTVLSAIHWNDSNSSLKAVLLTGPIVRFLAAEQLLNESIASNILIAVLQGLQNHGQHDANQTTLITLGVQVYEILRPKFPHIVNIIQQIPNTNIVDIQKLDEKIAMGATKGNKIDKAKKDLFKKLTAQLVGKNLGQLFRKEIKIINLPPMNGPSRKGNYVNLVDSGESTGIEKIFSINSS